MDRLMLVMKMNKRYMPILQTVVLLLTMSLASCSAEQAMKSDQPQQHSYLCSDIGTQTLLKVSADGKVEWEQPVEICTDAWMLKNGNILFTFGGAETRGVREVTPDKKTVWEYTTTEEIYACQRLKNGNTVFNNWFMHQHRPDQHPFIEVTPDKKVVWKSVINEKMSEPVSIQILDEKSPPLR